MNKGDIPKSAVITPFGLFEWVRMPFGLRNAGCTFQRLMDQILGDILHCFVYINDILIASPDAESHLRHVRQVFDRLRLHGLSINPEKCVFAAQELDYLGMRVSSKGCVPLEKHSEAVFVSPLVLPGEFLDSLELPSLEYLCQIQQIIKNNPIFPPHNISTPTNPVQDQIPPSLLHSFHVFVREDSSKPPLSPLYRGPYLVISRSPKYFSLQVGSKTDAVSVDQLKPVLLEFPVTVQEPPCRDRPPAPKHRAPVPPAPKPPAPSRPTSLPTATAPKKKVHFSPPVSAAAPARRNPRRVVRDKHLFSLHVLKMLEGPLWRT